MKENARNQIGKTVLAPGMATQTCYATLFHFPKIATITFLPNNVSSRDKVDF